MAQPGGHARRFTPVIQTVLMLLSAAGAVLTWVLLLQNGTFAKMVQIRDEGPHLLPSTTAPLRQRYTGLGPVDDQLQLLMIFFFEVVAGQPPAAAIQALRFAGQLGGAWLLVCLEAQRFGRAGGVLAPTVLWGVLVQNAAYAVVVPLYLALHLGRSRTRFGREQHDAAAARGLAAAPADLVALPVAIVVGFVGPTALLALPAPAVVSFEQKQIFNAVWQVFPVWVALVRAIVANALPRLSPASFGPDRASNKHTLNLLRSVYVTAVLMAGTSHIAAVTLPLAYDCVPTLFNPNLAPISLRSVFVPNIAPPGLNAGAQAATVAIGAQNFLQYDEFIGSAAVLLWAVYVYLGTEHRASLVRLLSVVATTVGLAAMVGPVGAAVSLIWMRDEEVLGPRETENALRKKHA